MSSELRHQLSLGLNIVLAVAVVVLALRKSEPAPAPVYAKSIPPARVSGAGERTVDEYPQAASASAKREWLVAQLRAMGVPNKVLARIVLADLDWAWNKRGGEVSLQTHGDPDALAALKLENAMSLDAQMRAALGEEGFRQWDRENMLREANRGGLSFTPAETDGAYALWKNLQRRELELRRSRLKAELDEVELGAAFGEAVAEFEQGMKRLLGEERYAKARQIDEGANLRTGLASANLNDAQFQDLLETQKQWNALRFKIERQFQDDPSVAAYAEQLSVLDEARDQEYRRVLGSAAFETFQKEQHPSYALMTKHAGLWGLDAGKIDSVYGSIRYYEKAVQDYQAQARAIEMQGQTVDWDGINQNLRQFADQTQQAVRDVVGPDSFERMQRNGVFQFDRTASSDAPLKPGDRAGGG